MVSSRLCVDWHRGKYGRWTPESEATGDADSRRKLVDLVGDEVGLDRLPDGRGGSPEAHVRQVELSSALREAVDTLEPEDRLLLRLRFEDGVSGEVDVSEMIEFRGVFAPLRDETEFARVRVDPDSGTIVWPNGADLDPDVLYSAVSGKPIAGSGQK